MLTGKSLREANKAFMEREKRMPATQAVAAVRDLVESLLAISQRIDLSRSEQEAVEQAASVLTLGVQGTGHIGSSLRMVPDVGELTSHFETTANKRRRLAFHEMGEEIEQEIRREALAVMQKHPTFKHFVKGMGSANFILDSGEQANDNDPRLRKVMNLLKEWDEVFNLTGDPVWIKANGEVRTSWRKVQ